MSDVDQGQQFEDETERVTPEPERAKPEPQVIDNDPQPERGGLKDAAALVPVGPHGAAPTTFENQITYAQAMAKAVAALPQHLRNNVGDCLAIVDIASRAGLSPYMVANKTYKQNDRLAFESQLYHAFLIQSGWLKDSSLHVKYEGEGDARTCTVWGTLRNETEPRYYTTPPFSKLHPGMVTKTVDGKQTTYVKGSPLWTKKPDVQMFYDASRDWGRMFCPIATLGMMDAYEMQETPIGAAGAVEIIGSGEGLHERLKGSDKTEGHQPGHVESELANVASEAKTEIKPAGEQQPEPPKPAKKSTSKKKIAADPKPEPERTTTLAKPNETVTKTEASKIADRAEATGKAKLPTEKPGQETDTPPAKVPTKPENAAEYQVYAIDWIDRKGDPEGVLQRWEAELPMRDDLSVPIKIRNMLRARLETMHGI